VRRIAVQLTRAGAGLVHPDEKNEEGKGGGGGHNRSGNTTASSLGRLAVKRGGKEGDKHRKRERVRRQSDASVRFLSLPSRTTPKPEGGKKKEIERIVNFVSTGSHLLIRLLHGQGGGRKKKKNGAGEREGTRTRSSQPCFST